MLNRSLNKQIAKAQMNSEKIIFLKAWQEQVEPHLRAFKQVLSTLNGLLHNSQPSEERDKKIEVCKATLGSIEKLLIPSLETFTNNLEKYDLVRVTKKQAELIKQCLLQVYEVGCLLLSNNILLSSLQVFICETRLRNFMSVRSVPLSETPIRPNHIDSLNTKFFFPPSWLGLIHTALKLLKIYKLTHQDTKLVDDITIQLNNYFKQCEDELKKPLESKAQYLYYYQVCQAAYALSQDNIEGAIDLLSKLPEDQIKDDDSKKFIFELYAASCYPIATHFYEQNKTQEALTWFNHCLPHIKYLPQDYQTDVKTKLETLESLQKEANLGELTNLIKTINTDAIRFEICEAKGILRIQVFKKAHAYLLRKGLLKANCNFDEDNDNTFTIKIAYCPTQTIKRYCVAISHIASSDAQAPYVPYELVETLPAFQPLSSQTQEVESYDQLQNKPSAQSEKEQKLARHQENELKRQLSKMETEATKPEVKDAHTPNEGSKSKPTLLKWNKNYPSINKNSTEGTLVQYYSQRKCYYHFFLHSTVTNGIAKNQILDEKVQSLIEDPSRSLGKQGILFTSDRAGNRFFKLKISGLGNGFGARIGGYIDDLVYDDEHNPHYAINLDILKLKHL